MAVMEAWTGAMKALDSLVQGAPQSIDSGAVLLGLSSWHLYPDIFLADCSQHIKQDDPFVGSGGLITIGLKNRDSTEGRGVFWSLPLSQAKYYGDPVVAVRHTGIRESQVEFSDLAFVVLGSVLSGWNVPNMQLDVFLNLIRTIANSDKKVSGERWAQEMPRPEWIHILGDAAGFMGTIREPNRRQQITRLITLGQRRCANFLSRERSRPPPVFGLTHLPTLIRKGFLPSDDAGRVDFLRNWATRKFRPEILTHAIIRHFADENATSALHTKVYSPASSIKKQKRGGGNSSSSSGRAFSHWYNPAERFRARSNVSTEIYVPAGDGEQPTRHIFLCGDPSLAAIYIGERCAEKPPVANSCMTAPELIQSIEEGDLEQDHIARALRSITLMAQRDGSSYFRSLHAFAVANRIYSTLDGVRVDLQVTSKVLSAARWYKQTTFTSTCSPGAAAILSCIAYFQTGGMDIDPTSIGEVVFAICHSNSIFVLDGLLEDPANHVEEGGQSYSGVQRIIGNVGKPGLAFLMAPANPRVRKLDFGSWQMVAHEPFDGTPGDGFKHTSFHLSFTGYELPADVGHRHGDRDVSAYFLETEVSVYDRGEWVADLDILKATEQWKRLHAVNASCPHPRDYNAPGQTPNLYSLVSVDTWLELLDPPVGMAIVRSNGNATARLAAAALATRQCGNVIVLPRAMCWSCCSNLHLRWEFPKLFGQPDQVPEAPFPPSNPEQRGPEATAPQPLTLDDLVEIEKLGSDAEDAVVEGVGSPQFRLDDYDAEDKRSKSEDSDIGSAGYFQDVSIDGNIEYAFDMQSVGSESSGKDDEAQESEAVRRSAVILIW